MASSSLEIKMFPCLFDNYGFLIHDAETNLTATIDTPEVSAIQNARAQKKWQLTHIINTHHHFDHAVVISSLNEKPDCTILGPAWIKKGIPGIDVAIEHKKNLNLAT
ncbi:MAG: hypothetical protein Ct9H300mP4_16470 [Gammaproteobacteria bacterium]|nr:MAG: hypothetical protein Ct9H300mP4_16470 [Gammaproteobacteria bacterium]